MDIPAIVLRLIGGFYVFAGLASMRAIAMDKMMDLMLSAISLKPQPVVERQKRALWLVSSLGIGMGGAALVVLSAWAVPLFLIGLLTQVVYLIWAQKAFVPANADEEKGRRQTTNAAILYGAVTLLVCLAFWSNLLEQWLHPLALVAPATGIFMLGTVGRHLIWTPRSRKFSGLDDDPDVHWPEPEPLPEVRRVKLEARWGSYALIDMDTDKDCLPDHYLPVDLANRIHTWQYSFGADDDERTLHAVFEDQAEEAWHRREGASIVEELKSIFGEGNASGPFYPAKVVYVGPSAADDDNKI